MRGEFIRPFVVQSDRMSRNRTARWPNAALLVASSFAVLTFVQLLQPLGFDRTQAVSGGGHFALVQLQAYGQGSRDDRRSRNTVGRIGVPENRLQFHAVSVRSRPQTRRTQPVFMARAIAAVSAQAVSRLCRSRPLIRRQLHSIAVCHASLRRRAGQLWLPIFCNLDSGTVESKDQDHA